MIMNGGAVESISVDGDQNETEVQTGHDGKSTFTSRPSNPPVITDHTQLANSSARLDEDEPQSAIPARRVSREFPPSDVYDTSAESVSDKSNVTILKSPTSTAAATNGHPDKKNTTSPVSPHALTAAVASSPLEARAGDATPRAQTREEVQRSKGKRPDSLEGIPENLDGDAPREDGWEDAAQDTKTEPDALRAALSECWTLCNTLATLSCSHRQHLFDSRGKNDKQEHAWKTCWKLCQNLYGSWVKDSDSHPAHVKPTLELCREFCQALFDIRPRDNEMADSVLRVSFELNNHLYNTHDRSLPEAFRERTLDFYVTLCHRLMKQRAGLTEETDSLLRACWSLAEMLFNLRQSKSDGKPADEDLLGSTVQACWELCDLFREGWSQVRPSKRGLSQESQTSFAQGFFGSRRRETTLGEDIAAAQANPETPTTIFDDTATVAADQGPVPNIVVLGGTGSDRGGNGNGGGQPPKWSSSTSSTLSGYSSHSASSTHTIRSQTEDPSLICLKLLVVRAAVNNGFQRTGPQPLTTFVKSLSSDAFGSLPWQTSLLVNYRKLVTDDPTFRTLPPRSRASAVDVARSVELMVHNSEKYIWLLDLYRWVFGFRTHEAVRRNGVTLRI